MFHEPFADATLALVRITLAISILFWVSFGPLGPFYSEEEHLLYSPSGLAALVPRLGTEGLLALRVTVGLGCIGMLARRTPVVSTRVVALSYGVLNAYVSGFSAPWNYNSHTNTFLVALCLQTFRSKTDGLYLARCSAILYFMRLQVSMIYLQAGLAKLAHGGMTWPSTTPFVHVVLQDSWASHWLRERPLFVAFGGVLALSLELIVPFLLLFRRTRAYGALALGGLHGCLFLGLGISFWQVWSLFPALFLECHRLWPGANGGTHILSSAPPVGSS